MHFWNVCDIYYQVLLGMMNCTVECGCINEMKMAGGVEKEGKRLRWHIYKKTKVSEEVGVLRKRKIEKYL